MCEADFLPGGTMRAHLRRVLGLAALVAVCAATGHAAVGVSDLRDRPYTAISGGERQLVLVARGLAQGAGCLLMDEPAAHLDPHHQHGVFRVVRQLAGEGFSFAVASHHPDNALLYADEVVLLASGAVVAHGEPHVAISEETLCSVYGMEFEILRTASGARAVLPRLP